MKGEDRKEGKKPGRPRWGVDEGLARSHSVCPTLGTPPPPRLIINAAQAVRLQSPRS